MSEFNNNGQVSLLKGNSDNERAPVLRGTVVAHRAIQEGEEIDIALWKNQTDNERAPVLKGKVSDKYVKSAAPAPQQIEQPVFDPDDIPF